MNGLLIAAAAFGWGVLVGASLRPRPPRPNPREYLIRVGGHATPFHTHN